MKAIQQRVIEMIALQATSLYSTQHAISWHDMEVHDRPSFGESWFWDNFTEMVDEAVMALKDAVEAWVTVEYEEDIIDTIDSRGVISRWAGKPD